MIRVYFRRVSLVVTSTIVVLVAALQGDAHQTIRNVALSNEHAAGTSFNSNWLRFETPVINDLGRVAFIGQLSAGTGDVNLDNDRGVWSENATGQLQLIAREGDAAPGTIAGQRYYDFYQLRVSNEGHTAIGAQVRTPGQRGAYGIWRDDLGRLQQIVREELPAPGMPAGLVFRGGAGFHDEMVMNEHGEIVFSSRLGPATKPNTSLVDSGIWRTDNGELRLIAAYNQPAPGRPGRVFGIFDASSIVMNDSGEVAFLNQGLWSGAPEALQFHGQFELGTTPHGTRIYDFRPHIQPNPLMNNRGEFAFVANGETGFPGESQGIWAYRDGTYQAIALAGQPTVGMPEDERLSIFSEFAINGSGEVAFVGLSGKLQIFWPLAWGVWHEHDGSIERVAGQGQLATGAASGETFGYFTDIAINRLGQIAFRASLIGPEEELDTNADSIWAQDIAGNLKLIARVGDELSSQYRGTSFSKTVASLEFVGNDGNQSGLPSGFNELGQLVFRAIFSDGTSGVFVSNLVAVPEPSSLMLIAVAVLVATTTRVRERLVRR